MQRGTATRLPHSSPVDVSIAFSPHASTIPFEVLTKSLVNFVHQHNPGSSSSRDLPKGYCYIGIQTPRREPLGHWHGPRAFDVVRAAKPLLDARIAEKNQQVAGYRAVARTVWLLIVNDQFLGPGEVIVRADDLAAWSFNFAFDKVLFFLR